SPGTDRLNIFVRGSDGHIWGIWYAGGWGGWGDLGCCAAGDVTNPIAATSQAPMTLDLFEVGTLHDLDREHYDYYNNGWGGWQNLDQSFVFTNIAATAWVPTAPVNDPPDPNCGIAGHPPCHPPQ